MKTSKWKCKEKWKSSAGMTLLEVLIAVTILGIFVTALITSESHNVNDSGLMRKNLILQKLCENKINEILLSPPKLEESLTLAPQTGNFSESGYPEYEFSIEFKRLKIPDLSKIMGGNSPNSDSPETAGAPPSDPEVPPSDPAGSQASSQAGSQANSQAGAEAMQNKVFEMIKKNIEEILWQVKVTVKEKGIDYPMTLTSFITNRKAKVRIEL